VHLIGVHLTGVCLTGVHLIGVYFIGMHPRTHAESPSLPKPSRPSNIKRTRGKTVDFVALHIGPSTKPCLTTECRPMTFSRTYFKPPSHQSACHCVGWHVVVCYGGPEWFRFLRQTPVSIATDASRALPGQASKKLGSEMIQCLRTKLPTSVAHLLVAALSYAMLT
jgi:hypothetical protein